MIHLGGKISSPDVELLHRREVHFGQLQFRSVPGEVGYLRLQVGVKVEVLADGNPKVFIFFVPLYSLNLLLKVVLGRVAKSQPQEGRLPFLHV